MSNLYTQQVEMEDKLGKEAIFKKSLELQESIAKGTFNETHHGQLILKLCFEPLKNKIEEYFKASLKGTTNKDRNLILLLNDDPPSIAYLVLNTLISRAATNMGITSICESIAQHLFREYKYNKLREDNPKLHTYLGSEYRRASGRRKKLLIDKHLKFIEMDNSEPIKLATMVRLGATLIDLVLLTNTDVFEKYAENMFAKTKGVRKGVKYRMRYTANGMSLMEQVDWKAMALKNVNLLPMIHPPDDWTTNTDGGYLLHKQPLLSVSSLDVRKWQKRQDFSNIYPVVNKLQRTAWKVNSEMLDLIQDVIDGNIIDPSTEVLPIKTLLGGLQQENPTPWWETIKEEDYGVKGELTKEQFPIYRKAKEKHIIALDSAQSKRIQLRFTLGAAHIMRDYERFYYTYQLDYRGRMYPTVSHLSHQGPKYNKALLEFADGRHLTEEGLWWLKVHTANVFGNDKMLFKDRVIWFEDNRAMILEVAKAPLLCKSHWIDSDSPYEFVAACKAYRDHIDGKEVHLPIQLDAICSGISMYSGLLLDKVGAEETAIINKYGESGEAIRPDIYKTVADRVNSYLRAGEYSKHFSYTTRDGKEVFASSYVEGTSIIDKVTRSIVKPNVMTVPYSVTMRGMSNQLWDIMEEAKEKGKEFWKGEEWVVNKILTSLDHRAIYDIVKGARVGQDYLVNLSKLLGRQAEWVTPLYNFPIKQTSLKTKVKAVQTLLGTLVINIEVPKLDKKKQSQSIAPNFIHSLDSEILKYCIDKMDNGIGVIHDCVLVHPNDGYEAQDVYRDGYVKLMETNPLERLQDQLDPSKEIPLPTRGELELKEVYKSKYIIS